MIGPLRDRDVSWWAAAFLKELAAQQNEAHRQKNLGATASLDGPLRAAPRHKRRPGPGATK